MQDVVCWEPREVFAIINPEAESMPDFVFKAVHSDQPLKVAQPVGDKFEMLRDSFVSMSAADLLVEFLRPERRHVQMAVFGRSGSGKSHLIHWMRLAIPDSERRMVITIPKAGTSLRSVVELIISQLPVERQAPFKEALARAGDSALTREGQKHELLNQIAQAIREDFPRQSGPDGELEQALIDHLPDFFQDAYIRGKHFLKEETVVSALVDHVFAIRTQYAPLDERQRFSPEDIPIGGLDLMNASKPARDAIQVLNLNPDRTLPLAAVIINRALDGSAIARAFGFSGDRVTDLMTDLRRHLRQADRELVLLIEDFAQLQGIDRALLQALLTQGNDEICDIRWAIAATTGFFETVAETVYTRMTYFVDMDRSSGDSKGRITEGYLANFAGRYLNAARLGMSRLVAWSTATDQTNTVPNACDGCRYRETCHSAFKTSDDGFGLYPFTRRALWNMAARADDRLETSFNPRTLQRSVLARVLDSHARALKMGAFPPRALLDELGGTMRLGVIETDKLRRSVPPTQFDQALTFEELWNGSSTIAKPPPLIAEAFRLPLFDGSADNSDDQGDEIEQSSQGGVAPPVADPRLAELDDWAAGGALKQTLANKLRVILYEAIVASIDWDAESLERSKFAGATETRPFRQRSIAFQRQDTQPQLTQVKLLIPPAGSDETAFEQTALALRGLLLAENGAEWAFPNGTTMLIALQECLSQWAADVIKQIKMLQAETATWNPVAASAELLAIGACLAGAVKPDGDLVELLNVSLGGWPAETAAQNPVLQGIYASLHTKREKFVELIRSVASGTKGGRVGGFLDPGSVLPALATLRRKAWHMSQHPPEDDQSGDWGLLSKTYRDTVRSLESGANTERRIRLGWLGEMEEFFGVDARRAEIAKSISDALEAAVAAGLAGSKAASLREKIDQFLTVQFDDTIRATALLREGQDALSFLPHYGRGRTNAVLSGQDLSTAAREFLAHVDSELTNLEAQFGQGQSSIPGDLQLIERSLEIIRDELPEIQK